MEVEENVATSQFSVCAAGGADAPTNTSTEDASSKANETSFPLEIGEVPLEVLQYIKEFAVEFSSHPRAPASTYEALLDNDKEKLEKAMKANILIPLYDAALWIGFDTLRDICAMYLSAEIDQIACTASDPMEGAERVRQLLNMTNEWTDAEMEHLRKEMELSLALEPKAN